MARWQPWQVIDGAYKDDARPWSAQDTCNWLPTPAEQAGTRSSIILRTPPGLKAFCDLGTNAPIRGSHDVEGLLLVVSGRTLFRVSASGVATSIGTIPGVGRVSMDHTPVANGFQVGIANGDSGYVYTTATNTLTQITDEGFPGAVIFQFIDGYLAFLEPFGEFWGISELNDAFSYNTLDRFTAESAPDRIRSLIVSHREVFAPGTRSGEFFRNTGQATATFQRSDGTEMERGIASPYAIARLDNTVYWLGEDGIVYRLENGHNPVRVSNGPLEQALSRSNLENAFAFSWEDKGHNVFYLTLPDGHTWGFDSWTGRWHRRQSYGLDRWRLATLTRSNGQWIGGDYTNGKLYTLTWAEDNVHEDGQPLVSERTFPVAHDSGNDLLVNGIRLLFDTGRTQISFPTISGNLPNGTIGQSISGAYTLAGGTAPYAVTVTAGTLPPGITLNADGTYSGTFSAAGSYSWTVGGTDAFMQPFSLPDSAVILGFAFGYSIWTGTGTGAHLNDQADMSGGGLSWSKARTGSTGDQLDYSVTGATVKRVSANTTAAASASTTVFSVNGASVPENAGGSTYVGYLMAKRAGFLDVIEYTGTGANRTVPHALGAVPGAILIKRTDTAANWAVYHSASGNDRYTPLNLASAEVVDGAVWNSTSPTGSVFTVGTSALTNAAGGSYVAFVLADGGEVECGTYTGTNTIAGLDVTTGWRPGLLLAKQRTNTLGATVFDGKRAPFMEGLDPFHTTSSSSAETAPTLGVKIAGPTATGFTPVSAGANVLNSALPYWYIAFQDHQMFPAATWNPNDKGSTVVLSSGDLQATAGIANYTVRGNRYHSSGKWYFEMLVNSVFSTFPMAGLARAGFNVQTLFAGQDAEGWAIDTLGQKNHSGSASAYATSYGIGAVVGVAVDIDAGKVWFSVNNVWGSGGNPAAGTGAAYTDANRTLYPCMTVGGTGSATATGRFTAAQQTYAAPSGFTPWGDA